MGPAQSQHGRGLHQDTSTRQLGSFAGEVGEHHSELAAITQPDVAPGLSDPASHAFNSYQVPLVLSTRNGGGHGGTGWMFQNYTCQGDLDLVALLTLCTITQEAQW